MEAKDITKSQKGTEMPLNTNPFYITFFARERIIRIKIGPFSQAITDNHRIEVLKSLISKISHI